jgi:hypothetical protein
VTKGELPPEYVCNIMGHDKIVVTHERARGTLVPVPVKLPYVGCARCGEKFPEMDHFFWDETVTVTPKDKR